MASDNATRAIVATLRRSAPALLLVVGILSFLGIEGWRSYRAAYLGAEQNIQNLVRVLSEQTERTVQSIDLSLQGVVADLASGSELADNDTRFLAELRKRTSSLPYVRALFVIGPDGFISHDTDYPATPRVSLADRPYFMAHRDNPKLGLRINTPLRSRSLGGWFVALSRRIERSDGSFGGIVVAAMEPLFFERFYRQLWVGGGTIALLHTNGTLLARSPHDDAIIGSSFAHVAPFNKVLRQGSDDVLWARSPIDGVERVAGYRVLANEPLVLLVTMDKDEVLQSWRSHMIAIGIGAAILIAMLASIEIMTRSYQRREKRIQARLIEAERLESIGRFAAGVAHDVGNLLRIMRSAAILLRPQLVDRTEARQLLGHIDATLTTGGELVGQLLSYARTGDLKLQVADLNAIVLEAEPMLRQAAGPRVEMLTLFAASALPCQIDPFQFRSVLLNLVLNARDAMPEGGTMVLGLSCQRDKEDGRQRWAEVRVSDDGAGMSHDVLERALVPFFSTREAGQGNGLGLSQVRRFIDFNQGKLEIASEEGGGTTIRLRLPLVEDGMLEDPPPA